MNSLRPELVPYAAALAGTIIAWTAASANAAEGSNDATVTVIEENDSFVHRRDDRHYTNGFYVSWTSGKSETADLYTTMTDQLLDASSGRNPASYRHGVFFGQSIFTPQDLSRTHPDPKDRPYAGWLYVGGDLYRETSEKIDKIEAKFGIVGPWSLAENAQIWMHSVHLFGGVHPRGWANQLHNEPGIVLTRQRIWRKGQIDFGQVEIEALPELNGSVGNIFTYVGAGTTLRLGNHLGADWGPPRIAPALEGANFVNNSGQPVAWYAYASIEARAIARNILLDGNSFRDSANIARRPLVLDTNLGFAVIGAGVNLYFAYTMRSREFKAQRNNDQLVAFTASFTD